MKDGKKQKIEVYPSPLLSRGGGGRNKDHQKIQKKPQNKLKKTQKMQLKRKKKPQKNGILHVKLFWSSPRIDTFPLERT